MVDQVQIRAIYGTEIPQLESFLYDAIFIREGMAKPARGITKLPEMIHYIQDFGKDTDLCLVAEYEGHLIGAIWSRLFDNTSKGYGYVDEKIPELSMSVREEFRNKGIGKKLFDKFLQVLRSSGFEKVSLSVDTSNFMLNFYEGSEFKKVKTDGNSAIMIKNL